MSGLKTPHGDVADRARAAQEAIKRSQAARPLRLVGRPTFVGEVNPYGSDPGYALYPRPVNSSGWRLCHAVLGVSEEEYLTRTKRLNLCYGEWDRVRAQSAARGLVYEQGLLLDLRNGLAPRVMVLLGAKVCKAFGAFFVPFSYNDAADALGPIAGVDIPRGRLTVVVLPHPSGLSRAWNQHGSMALAKLTLKKAGALA